MGSRRSNPSVKPGQENPIDSNTIRSSSLRDYTPRQTHGLPPLSVGSPRLAVRADAGELDHRRFRRKAGGARRGGQRRGDVARRRLPDGAAALADEKHHQRAGGVIVHAGDKGVAAFDAVHEAVLTQELERAVSGDRRQARPLEREPIDDLVGAQRLVAAQERGEHLAPDRGQALAALRAQRLGYGHGIARTASWSWSGCGNTAGGRFGAARDVLDFDMHGSYPFWTFFALVALP